MNAMPTEEVATERGAIMSRFGFAFVLALSAAAVSAQDPSHGWPARAVRIIVPSSPGGATDRYARLLAQGLSENLKHQFIVDNRPGASGNIGAVAAARAVPDGYTILVASNQALAISPSLERNLPYNVERDFAPVARGVMIRVFVFVVHPSLQAKTLADLVAIGKREPGKLPYGSAGAASPAYLCVRMFEEASGARFLHVPFKGLGQGMQSLMSGDIKFTLADIGAVLPHIRSGRLLALAVTERTASLPGTPTLAEAGYPNLEVFASFSVVAPSGTPRAIVQRLGAEVVKAMKSPPILEKLEAQAMIPVFDTPDVFAASLKKESEMWARVIRRNAITADQ